MDTVDDLGEVLLLIQISQLEDETLGDGLLATLLRNGHLHTSGRPTCRTKLKKMLMLSECRKSSFGAYATESALAKPFTPTKH